MEEKRRALQRRQSLQRHHQRQDQIVMIFMAEGKFA
jgi:hypothetical protein